MKLKRIWWAIRWVASVTAGFARFLSRNPRATPAVLKFIVANLHTLPRRLQYKTHIDEEKARIERNLAECTLLFNALNAPDEDSFTIKWLEENTHSFPDRWAPLYMLIRILKAKAVVETGVAEGESTSHILKALADNGNGLLCSIDLPNRFYLATNGKFHAEFNPSQEPPGCLIPSELRSRWKLTLGKSCDVLPKILDDLGQIDLFLHDSEHTYETMFFEFACAWPHIRPGGYLVSDDASWNSAFSDFAKQQCLEPIIVREQGFLRKPEI